MANFGWQVDELLELKRPLYDRCDAGDYWSETMNLHIVNDLGINETAGGSSLDVRNKDGWLLAYQVTTLTINVMRETKNLFY